MRFQPKFNFFFLVVLLLCGACVSQARALALSPWVDATLPFEISLPEGWTLSQIQSSDGAQYLIAPEDFTGLDDEFRVYLYFAQTEQEDLAIHLQDSTARLESWMAELIDDEYEIYNKNELKIDKQPAVALDFAKPIDDTYLVGRVVMATHPTHTIAFVAMAGEEAWNANVRTFDKIIPSLKLKKSPN